METWALEPSLLEIDERLHDLFAGIHHEWSMPRDRFTQRSSRDKNEAGTRGTRAHRELVAATEHRELMRVQRAGVLAVDWGTLA